MTTASIWDDTKQRARPLSRGNTYGIKLFRHGGSDLLLVVVVAQASCESKKPNKGIFQNTMRTLSPFFHVNISSTFGCTYPACMGNRYIENRGMEEEPESLCKRRTTDANSGIERVCVRGDRSEMLCRPHSRNHRLLWYKYREKGLFVLSVQGHVFIGRGMDGLTETNGYSA